MRAFGQRPHACMAERVSGALANNRSRYWHAMGTSRGAAMSANNSRAERATPSEHGVVAAVGAPTEAASRGREAHRTARTSGARRWNDA